MLNQMDRLNFTWNISQQILVFCNWISVTHNTYVWQEPPKPWMYSGHKILYLSYLTNCKTRSKTFALPQGF